MNFGYCYGYVSGVTDGAVSAEALHPEICFPDGVTNGQIFDIALKFVRDNPDIRNWSTKNLIFVAVVKAFPCK